jgi:hypothetical protein
LAQSADGDPDAEKRWPIRALRSPLADLPAQIARKEITEGEKRHEYHCSNQTDI